MVPRSRPARSTTLCLAALALVLAACGSGSDPVTEATEEPAGATADATDSPAPATENGGAADDTAGDSLPFQDQLAAGDCFDDILQPNGDVDLTVSPAITPCDEPHGNEVFLLDVLPDTTDPAAVSDEVIARCDAAAAEFLGKNPWPIPTWAILPDAEEWEAGHRTFACATYGTDLIGTARSGNLTAPGRLVAAVTQIDDKTVLALYDGETGDEVALVSDTELFAQRSPASWVPGSDALYFTQGVDDVDRQVLLNTPESETVVLEGLNEVGSPSVGPDGRLAFISSDDGDFDIYVTEPGGGPVRLTDNPDRDTSPRWSPDGSRIAYRARVDGNSDIWVMNADGSDPTRLTDDPAFDGDPWWSPDGDRIVFTSERSGNFDIWLMAADGSDQRALTTHPADDEYPSWAGDLIAFQSNRHGGPSIWLMTPDGDRQSRLTADAPVGHPALSDPLG